MSYQEALKRFKEDRDHKKESILRERKIIDEKIERLQAQRKRLHVAYLKVEERKAPLAPRKNMESILES